MNIVFIGASHFGLRCLETVLGIEGCDVTGVVTVPSEFKISYNKDGVRNVLYADFSSFCAENDIPCEIMNGPMTDSVLLEKVMAWNPDIFLVVGWYHMVPKIWRNVAPAYGMHASLLPDYSGGAPLVWAMINSEPKTGITFFRFDDGVDNGPVVGVSETNINQNDDIKSLYGRIEELGLNLLIKHLPAIANGTATLTLQDEEKRRIFPQRSPADGKIDWSQPAQKIYDFIRAQTTPYPGAFCYYKSNKVMIWSSRIVDGKYVSEKTPGTLFLDNQDIHCVCGDGRVLKIENIELADEVDFKKDLISGGSFD